jgi:Protein of unknown function (DUF3987)
MTDVVEYLKDLEHALRVAPSEEEKLSVIFDIGAVIGGFNDEATAQFAIDRTHDRAVNIYDLPAEQVTTALGEGRIEGRKRAEQRKIERADLEQRVADAAKPEPPRPLTRELPPGEPYPVDALGDILGKAARGIHDRVRVPMAIGAQSVLAAATLAVQAHINVVLPIGPTGRPRPVSNYFITVAVSGERKSESDRQADWSIEKREKTLREEYEAALLGFGNDKAGWEKARDSAIKRGKDRASIKNALDTMGPPPVPPLQPILRCPEPTLEGLTKLLADGQPSIGLFSTEGGQFIGGNGMNSDNRLKTVSGLSSIWDGAPICRVRSGDGATNLIGRRVAMHLMMQPDVASILLGDRLLADQGFLSRMLVVAPEGTIGTRMWRHEQSQTEADLKRYHARLLSIFEAEMPLTPGKSNELEPRSLPLSQKAQHLFVQFHDHVEREMREGGSLEPIRGLANKLPEHAARLGAVLATVNDLQTCEVSGRELEAGITLAKFYAGEAIRIFCQTNPDLQLAGKLLLWLQNQWGEPVVSLPDIYQRGPNAIRENSTAARMVRILEEHFWLTKIPGGAMVREQFRRDAWRIEKRRAA